MKAITAEGLSKTYKGGKKALSDVSFSLSQGEIFGFLGPNGAGKTTMVKLLNGTLAPTEGTCRVLTIDPSAKPEKVHKLSGVVTEHAQMYDNMIGSQNLIFYGKLFGLSAVESAQRADTLLKRLGLTDAKDKKLAAYSTGMRQRLSLARAIIHRPSILFLDEPTSGLDPESAQSVNNLIGRLAKEEGTTVFLCTHQLRYAQEICTSYGLIDEGILLAAGDIETLRSMVFSGMTVRIRTDRVPEGLPFQKNGEDSYEIKVQTEDEIPVLVRTIVESGGNVYHASAHRLSLEEIYFSLIQARRKRKEAFDDECNAAGINL